MRRRLPFLIPYAMLALAVALRVFDPWPIQQMRLLVFDSYQRMKPRQFDVRKSVAVIVAIDDESLKRLGQWPWPRTVIARMVERLAAQRVAAVVFDVVFAEPDASSPALAVKRWPPGPGLEVLKKAAAKLPSHDRILAAAFARAPVVTAFALTTQANKDRPLRKSGFVFAGRNPVAALPAFAGTVPSLPAFQRAARGNGSISFRPDRDLVIRAVPLFARIGNQAYPGLSAEALRVAARRPSYTIRAIGASGEIGGGIGVVAVRIGPFVIPTDARGQVVMYYAKSSSKRYIPAWRLLAGQVPAGALQGRIVFIGATAAGLKDLRATSLEAGIPGVEIHAQMIDQVVTKTFLLRPDFAEGVELVFIFLTGLVVLLLLPRIGPVWSGSLGIVAVAGAIAVSWLAFARWGWQLDPVYPAIAVILVVLTGTVIVYLRSEAERRQVRGAFSRYMSPDLVEQLAANPDRLKLGGENRELTMLFCDIRGFTTISETFDDAADLTGFINRFLTPMTELILGRKGTIDKYMGDCIMAFWNAPLDDSGHGVNGCRSALAMIDELERLNEDWRAEAVRAGKPFTPVRVGIGLNTGIACVGNLGSEQRFDYSVIGDEVNLASRLEGQCKAYGVDVIAGENTARAAGGLALLELDLIRVVGRAAPARIYTVLGEEATAGSAEFRRLEKATALFLEAYRARKWAEAEKRLKACRAAGGDALAGLHDMFQARIAAYRKTPPPKDWAGVYDAEAK